MSESARHLRVVDVESGEVLDGCPECAGVRDQLAGAEREIRGWRSRYATLAREKEREAQSHALWPKAIELRGYWRKACNHPRAGWDSDLFWLVHPFLAKDGLEMCKRAIDGAAFDAFTTTRKNGSVKRYDGWDLIFRNRDKFEEFCNRAPREA